MDKEDRKHISNRPTQSEKKSMFFLGGGRFWILTFLDREGRVPKKRPKNVSRDKIDLQVFPHFLGNQCPMNLSASRILMVLNLSQNLLKSTGVPISTLLVKHDASKCSEHKGKYSAGRPVCESWRRSSVFVFVLPRLGTVHRKEMPGVLGWFL